MDTMLIAARLVHFAGCMMLFGGALFPIYAGTEAAGAVPRSLPAAAGLLALVSGPLWLIAIVAGTTGDWHDILDPDTMRDILTGDAFGRLFPWRIGLVLAVLALAGSRRAAGSGIGRALMLIMSTLILGSLAFTGHTSIPKAYFGVHRMSQFVHLLAAGAWVGGLWPLAAILAEARRTRSAESLRAAQRVVWRFSSMGSTAVVLILASGVANGVFLAGKPAALPFSPYGRVLLVKIALVAGMIAVAAYNRVRLTPRLADDDSGAIPVLGRTVAAEQVLGLLILAAAAVLGTLVPAVYR